MLEVIALLSSRMGGAFLFVECCKMAKAWAVICHGRCARSSQVPAGSLRQRIRGDSAVIFIRPGSLGYEVVLRHLFVPCSWMSGAKRPVRARRFPCKCRHVATSVFFQHECHRGPDSLWGLWVARAVRPEASMCMMSASVNANSCGEA